MNDPQKKTHQYSLQYDEDMFQCWVLLSNSLAQSETLSEDKRPFCEEVFKKYLIARYLHKTKVHQ